MLLKIFAPVILIIGTIGNIVSFYIFTRSSIRGLSTFRFLAYLSIIDFLYVAIGIPHIMVIFYNQFDFRNSSNFICSLHSFLTIYLSHLSSNILAGVGVFRCVTLTTLRPVAYPHNKFHRKHNQVTLTTYDCKTNKTTILENLNQNSTNNKLNINLNFKKEKNLFRVIDRNSTRTFLIRFFSDFGNADIIVLAIMLILFLFDSHYLIWMRLSSESMPSNSSSTLTNLTLNHTGTILQASDPPSVLLCYPSKEKHQVYYDFYTRIWPWIDLFLYSYIPFSIMILCTILIIYRLCKINKRLKSHSSNNHRKDCKTKIVEKNQMSNLISDSNSNISKIKLNNTTNNNNNNINNSNNNTNTNSNINNNTNSNKSLRNSNISINTSSNKRPHHETELAKRRCRKNNQIYKLLLTLNLFFFVLVTPLVLFNSLGLLINANQTVLELVYILAYLNHSLNFLFYGLSCKMYRTILIDCIKHYIK